MIRAVIFDLDGTLADTADLATGNRSPWDVIAPGFHGPRDWSWSREMSDLPGVLISRGYRVVVATQESAPYSSTLLHLIGADAQMILPECGPGLATAERIRRYLPELGCRPDEVLYVGDTPDDVEIARLAGVHYADVSRAKSGELLPSLPPIRGADPSPVDRTGAAPAFARGRFLADTGPVDAAAVAERVAEAIRLGIPDDEAHAQALHLIFQHPEITKSDRAALCCLTLRQHPGSPYRRMFQHGLFAGLGPANDRCVIHRDGPMFHCAPHLVTKAELRADSDLRSRFLGGLGQVFPASSGSLRVGGTDVPIRVVHNYRIGFGDVLGVTKDYGGPKGTRWRSRANVHLGHLDLVGAMVASVLERGRSTPLAHIPSSPATAAQPGEFSLRLVHEVAKLATREVLPALARSGDEYQINEAVPPGDLVLVEDQVTKGDTLVGCLELLVSAGHKVRDVVSFSANGEFLSRINASPHRIQASCGFGTVSGWIGVPCHCGRGV